MLQTLIDQVWEYKFAFLSTFFFVFLGSYLFLVAIDFVPEPKQPAVEVVAEEVVASTDSEEELEEGQFPKGTVILPTSIHIKKLDRTIPVLNPDSRLVADLDAALLNGVVRHPDSADLAQDSNVFIIGHSSYLPSVINGNFQAFNGIQDLKWGDTIEVLSEGYVFTYEVEKVYKAKAEEVTVPIADTGPRLTLATCNSFGSKDDRFIVEAKRVSVEKR